MDSKKYKIAENNFRKCFSDRLETIISDAGYENMMRFTLRNGICYQTVYDLIRRKNNVPMFVVFAEVCYKFNVSADWLAGLSDDKGVCEKRLNDEAKGCLTEDIRMYCKEAFIERFDKIIKECGDGLSVYYISKMLGKSNASIMNYLRGDHFPNGNNLAGICSAFNVSVDWLLGFKN